MGVDKVGVDEMGVGEMGSSQSGSTPFASSVPEIDLHIWHISRRNKVHI